MPGSSKPIRKCSEFIHVYQFFSHTGVYRIEELHTQHRVQRCVYSSLWAVSRCEKRPRWQTHCPLCSPFSSHPCMQWYVLRLISPRLIWKGDSCLYWWQSSASWFAKQPRRHLVWDVCLDHQWLAVSSAQMPASRINVQQRWPISSQSIRRLYGVVCWCIKF